MSRLPPLKSLRYFEAVARRLSFVKASKDLFVTQSAVSQQIKVLEDHFGFKLFVRDGSTLILTEQGERLMPAVSEAFKLILDAVSEFSNEGDTITIKTSTSFAICWLMGRLHVFEKNNKTPILNINAVPRELEEFKSSSSDLEVLYSSVSKTPSESEVLVEEWLVPVCSPSFQLSQKISVHELVDKRILLNAPEGDDWKEWCKANNMSLDDFDRMKGSAMALPSDSAAIEMATSGHGIALANLHYVQTKLDSGDLVRAVNVPPYRAGIHYLSASYLPSQGSLGVVLNWIRDEALISSNSVNKRIKEWAETGDSYPDHAK